MNQIVGFKDFLIPKIMNGTKFYTTRIETPFRLKLDLKDTMYIFSGIRTKNAKKHADAIIKNRWRWNQYEIKKIYSVNEFVLRIENSVSPIGVKWSEFGKGEGFNSVVEFVQWFNQEEYLSKPLITWQFELIDHFEFKLRLLNKR